MDPNYPAFPCDETANINQQTGMSLREYFAAKAMQGLLAAYAGKELLLPSDETAARKAVAYADALIAELNKPKEGAS
jgi:hypothetical protein